MEHEPKRIEFRRPRGVADTINATFYFFREEFKGLARALLFLVGPLLVVWAVAYSSVLAIWGLDDPFEASVLMQGGAAAVVVILTLALSLLATLVLFAYPMVYSEGARQQVTPRDVWNRVRSEALRFISTILWSFVLFALVIAVGMFLAMILPVLGVIVTGVVLLFLVPIIVIMYPARLDRRQGFWPAFIRVRGIIKGHWWQALGLLIVTTVITWTLNVGLFLGISLITGMLASVVGGVGTILTVVTLTVMVGVGYLLIGVHTVAFVIFYFGLVEDHDSVALEASVEQMVAPPLGA